MRRFRSTVHRTYPIKGRPFAHKVAIRGAAWLPFRLDLWLLHKGNLAIDRRNCKAGKIRRIATKTFKDGKPLP